MTDVKKCLTSQTSKDNTMKWKVSDLFSNKEKAKESFLKSGRWEGSWEQQEEIDSSISANRGL